MSLNKRTYRFLYDHVQSHYYDLLTAWAFLLIGGEESVRRELLADVPLYPGMRVLDLCCGTGSATRFIAERVGDGDGFVTGVDLSVGQVRVAKRKRWSANVSFAAMDATATGFADAMFDCVVIPHALHEMPRAERMRVLAESARVLRAGGTLAVLELDVPPNISWRLLQAAGWFYWLPLNPETPTRRDLHAHGVDTEVREAGFVDVAKRTQRHGTLQVVTGHKAASE